MAIVNLCFIKWEEIIHALTINYSTNKHVGLVTYILNVLHAHGQCFVYIPVRLSVSLIVV